MFGVRRMLSLFGGEGLSAIGGVSLLFFRSEEPTRRETTLGLEATLILDTVVFLVFISNSAARFRQPTAGTSSNLKRSIRFVAYLHSALLSFS